MDGSTKDIFLTHFQVAIWRHWMLKDDCQQGRIGFSTCYAPSKSVDSNNEDVNSRMNLAEFLHYIVCKKRRRLWVLSYVTDVNSPSLWGVIPGFSSRWNRIVFLFRRLPSKGHPGNPLSKMDL